MCVCVVGGGGGVNTCRESFVDKSFQTLASEASNKELTPLLHPTRLVSLVVITKKVGNVLLRSAFLHLDLFLFSFSVRLSLFE